MKYLRRLGLLTTAAAAVMAFAGTASATTLTSPEGTTYTGALVGTSTNLKLHGAFVTVECSHSEFKAKVEQHGAGVNAGGKISSTTATGCNYPTTTTKSGKIVIRNDNGTIKSEEEYHLHTSVGTCTFTTNNTSFGSITEGSNATLDINSAKIPRTGGNFLCGSSGTMTGSYTITTPSTLYVD